MKFKVFLLALTVILCNSPLVFAEGVTVGSFSILQEYGLIEEGTLVLTGEDEKALLAAVVKKLQPFSDEKDIFLDLIDTLKKYSEAAGLNWLHKDLHKLAWALKDLDNRVQAKSGLTFKHRVETGFELEVLHSHGAAEMLFKDPFKQDKDGDGKNDIYYENEYMRQYTAINAAFSGTQFDGAVSLAAGVDFFGRGYVQSTSGYMIASDLFTPRFFDATFSLYGPYLTGTVGNRQILGLRDYLYYDDPTNLADFNLDGILLHMPYGILFSLGQETLFNAESNAFDRDTRWIAVGLEGIGSLPVNFYLTEQEFQTPDYQKISRNVVYAITTDIGNTQRRLSADLALNDEGDGLYAQLTGNYTLGKFALSGHGEYAEHFTPIQPKEGFTNTRHVRVSQGAYYQNLPARTERGLELAGKYHLTSGLDLDGGIRYNLSANEYTLGLAYQSKSGYGLKVTGKDDERANQLSLAIEANYQGRYGTLSIKEVVGAEGDLMFKAEPQYANTQVTVKGLLGYGAKNTTDRKNIQYGVEITYHPVKEFSFKAEYASEDMAFGVDLPGLKFSRIGSIEYKFNESVSADIIFENIEFRHDQYGYLVEYTKGGIKVLF